MGKRGYEHRNEYKEERSKSILTEYVKTMIRLTSIGENKY